MVTIEQAIQDLNVKNLLKGEFTMKKTILTMEEIANFLNNNGMEAHFCMQEKNGMNKEAVVVKISATLSATFYDKSFEHLSKDEILAKVRESLEERPSFIEIADEGFCKKDFILKNATVCLQQKSENTQLLTKNFLDLDAYIRVHIDENTSYALKKDFVKGMALDEDELWQRAKQNTTDLSLGDEFYGMPILKLRERNFGAGTIYCSSILSDFCQKHSCAGCYILPSSIHEVIVIPCEKFDSEDFKQMNNMVREVNASTVDEEEQLSQHAYYYNNEIGLVADAAGAV